ncbi:MAG TPA: CHRD domain-containing protein [Thermoanaerobaculia bacterium]|nr:CHRD domain-containing protein [Thermoanaerobaculia bacterium]
MTRLRALFAAAAVLALSVPAVAQTFVFDLRGSQEVPPVASVASGGCYGQLDQPGASFSVTCVHDVVNATVMHIHRGAPGVNGPILFDLGDPAVSPVVATWTGMTPADIADLLAGNLYINIHTAGRPSGEIRGQILSRTVDMVTFTANGAQVVPPNGSSATASCTADLDAPATSLAINCTHNVAGATAAHVHEAPFGANGPVVFTFASAASPLSANMPMTPRLVADFAATFLYLDIHTTPASEDSPSDEIRGQIGTPPAGAGTGTIIIAKQTSPSGGSGFGFTENVTPGPFTLNDGDTKTLAGVTPGTYTVTENDPSASNFTLGDVSCDDADSTGDVNARTATVKVAAGETVRCTFRNFATEAADSLFVFHLSGDQEVPPVSTPERGGCMGRFDAAASELSLICTHDVAFATIMHIHRGAPGVNGPIVFDLGTPTSPVIATWSGMTPADVADLMAGNLYVNIHTAGRPGGAIRGQILPRTVDTIAFTADASQVVPPGTGPATANCTADLSNAATSLAIDCTHNLASAVAAHVHQAPRGANGPIAFTFPSPASPLSANMPMTPRLVADFAAYFLYLDIHGPAASEGSAPNEIRGQIAPPLVVPTTGTIRIRKATSPAGGAGFTFTETVTNGGFTLNDGGERVFTGVPAGTYTVTEGTMAGWSLTDVACGDNDSTTNPAARTATVNLQANESVTCTFTNLQSVAAPTQFVFHLSGDQEVPPTGSTARGGCYGQLDTVARRLSLVCTHNVVGPTTMHIHNGAPGINGPVVFDLGDPISPVEATWNMSAAQMSDLLAGNYYVNIHTSGRPNGEIRGQMLTRTRDALSFTANAAQEVPPTDSAATGNCFADLSDNAASLFVQCTHNVASPTAIHLHDAPPGVDGPVIFDLPVASSFSGNAPLTPRLVADFAAGFLYVNIHSPNYPEGEIRGQIIGPAAAPVATVPTLGQWASVMLALMLAAVAWLRMKASF